MEIRSTAQMPSRCCGIADHVQHFPRRSHGRCAESHRVQYDPARDEWRVIAAIVNVGSDGKAPLPIGTTGAYALVYPDKGAGLIAPPLPAAGDVLRGVPAATAPALVKRDFSLNPPIILPSGKAVATLRIEGSGVTFPSGTAVQAYIDEELRLADGSRLLDPRSQPMSFSIAHSPAISESQTSISRQAQGPCSLLEIASITSASSRIPGVSIAAR